MKKLTTSPSSDVLEFEREKQQSDERSIELQSQMFAPARLPYPAYVTP